MNHFAFGDKDYPLGLTEKQRPNFNDLLDNAEAGIIRRGINRYLFSRNPDRSVKMHRKLGAPLVRKVVMSTVGKISPKGHGSNYRLDKSVSEIEAATKFAVGGSVINEGIHTVAGMHQAYELIGCITDGRSLIINSIGVGFNTALVGLQRYNRARMVQRVNQELKEDQGYLPYYENWLGLDSRAVRNYQNTLEDKTQPALFIPTDSSSRINPPEANQPLTESYAYSNSGFDKGPEPSE